MHMPLVLHTDGEKLSKQNGAQALNTHENPLIALNEAALFIGLPSQELCTNTSTALQNWTLYWYQKYIFE
jgi:glutamyl-Q tRNA(Asp) synthetase